jgi:hypothetical protein
VASKVPTVHNVVEEIYDKLELNRDDEYVKALSGYNYDDEEKNKNYLALTVSHRLPDLARIISKIWYPHKRLVFLGDGIGMGGAICAKENIEYASYDKSMSFLDMGHKIGSGVQLGYAQFYEYKAGDYCVVSHMITHEPLIARKLLDQKAHFLVYDRERHYEGASELIDSHDANGTLRYSHKGDLAPYRIMLRTIRHFSRYSGKLLLQVIKDFDTLIVESRNEVGYLFAVRDYFPKMKVGAVKDCEFVKNVTREMSFEWTDSREGCLVTSHFTGTYDCLDVLDIRFNEQHSSHNMQLFGVFDRIGVRDFEDLQTYSGDTMCYQGCEVVSHDFANRKVFTKWKYKDAYDVGELRWFPPKEKKVFKNSTTLVVSC